MPATAIDTITPVMSAACCRRRRPLWVLPLEIVSAMTAVVLALEGIFYLSGTGEQEYLKPDRLTGCSPMAGKRVTWRQEGFSRTVFNRCGMRDRELSIAKPAGCFRVAVLGDSYVEALQVENEKTFCRLLESKLKSRSTPLAFEVMNFGVSGYNLGQMYLRLKHLALSFKPDLVLLCLRIDQSPQLEPRAGGGLTFARPTFTAGKNGVLIQDNFMQEAWNKSAEGRRMKAAAWLREHSRLWGVASLCVARFARQNTKLPQAPVEASADAQWPVADALIAACKYICRRNNCRLALVALPGPGLVHNFEQRDLLLHSASGQAIPFLDLTPAFIRAARAHEHLFFVTHMNEQGHNLAAREILHFVDNNHLITTCRQSRRTPCKT